MPFDTDFLVDLLRIPSVTSDKAQVGRAVEAMRARLSAHGLHCTVERVADGRDVLYASVVPGEKTPALLLNAHLDVVPAPPEMFEPRIEGSKILGRGTADCKGNAVVIAAALEELAGSGVSVAALFSSDEETGGDSAAAMDGLGYRATNLTAIFDAEEWAIANAQKGMATFRLVAHGRGEHSSEPWNADNPIDKLFEGWARVRAAWPTAPDGEHWCDTAAATVVRAGEVENQIPDTAEMLVNVRWIDPAGLPRIEKLLRDESGLEVECIRSCPPVFCDESHPVMRALASAMEKAHGAPIRFYRMNGATDARHFASHGVPVAILGASGGWGFHTVDEGASLASFRENLAWLVPFAREFAAPGGTSEA